MFETPEELYCLDHSGPQSILLAELERITLMRSVYPRMISGALQGRFLSFISRMVCPLRILEIGTFTGFSALCLCEGLQPGGKLVTIDCNPEIETLARQFFDKSQWSSQIELIIGSALDVLPTIDEPFDLIFMDADKENYPAYLAFSEKLLKKGGLLLADNVLWGGKVLDPGEPRQKETRGIMAFNNRLAEMPNMEVLMLPLRDGLTLARKKS